MLKEIRQEIERAKVDDVLLFGDDNENVYSPNITNMMIANELFEIFREIHEVTEIDRDETYKHGTKCIDAAFGTAGVFRLVRGIELIDFDKLMDADHRGFIIK